MNNVDKCNKRMDRFKKDVIKYIKDEVLNRREKIVFDFPLLLETQKVEAVDVMDDGELLFYCKDDIELYEKDLHLLDINVLMRVLEWCHDFDRYAFVPAYYEWHFIDKDNPDVHLLNWVDPFDNDLCEAKTYEDVLEIVHEYYLLAHNAMEEGEKEFEGIPTKRFALLPPHAEWIMAEALYNAYVAE